MTRINSNIHPSNILNEHLFAEYKELPRIPRLLERRIKSGKPKFSGVPDEFKLGEGHVLFFLNKTGYLNSRFMSIVNELKLRGYKHQNFELYVDEESVEYEFTNEHNDIVYRRMIDNITISDKQFYYFRKKKLTKQQAISFYKTKLRCR